MESTIGLQTKALPLSDAADEKDSVVCHSPHPYSGQLLTCRVIQGWQMYESASLTTLNLHMGSTPTSQACALKRRRGLLVSSSSDGLETFTGPLH